MPERMMIALAKMSIQPMIDFPLKKTKAVPNISGTSDMREGMQAFLAKRPAAFTGR